MRGRIERAQTLPPRAVWCQVESGWLHNCVALETVDQADLDEDGIGDVCDTDRDGDGVLNADADACASNPDDAASLPVDADADGLCDLQDNCPALSNADQADADADGAGDGVGDVGDICPVDASRPVSETASLAWMRLKFEASSTG